MSLTICDIINIVNILGIAHRLGFHVSNTTFRKLDIFPSLSAPLGPVIWKQIQFPETSHFKELKTVDNVRHDINVSYNLCLLCTLSEAINYAVLVGYAADSFA
jgi:hypothetical protein